MQSKKKQAKKAQSKIAWTKFREEILKKSGYTKLKAKHGKSARPEIPDYKVESPAPLSNKVANGFVQRTGAQHKDAKKFPVYEAHKSNPVLMIRTDDSKFAGGKKT